MRMDYDLVYNNAISIIETIHYATIYSANVFWLFGVVTS